MITHLKKQDSPKIRTSQENDIKIPKFNWYFECLGHVDNIVPIEHL